MNHNQPPEHRLGRDGEPGDWDLTISLAEAEALSRRLDAAAEYETLVEGTDARIIAACLSDYLGAAQHSAVRRFAETGGIDAGSLRADCLAAHTSAKLPSALRRWTAWLITYTAHALPPGAGGMELSTNGDALDVFLKLPDLDRTSDTLLTEFKHAYCGSYVDINAVLDGVSDVLEWERKIHKLAQELGCEEFVSIDREAIEWHLRDGWDVIPSHGRLHVFFQ
jgi:hypothetical protein